MTSFILDADAVSNPTQGVHHGCCILFAPILTRFPFALKLSNRQLNPAIAPVSSRGEALQSRFVCPFIAATESAELATSQLTTLSMAAWLTTPASTPPPCFEEIPEQETECSVQITVLRYKTEAIVLSAKRQRKRKTSHE